MENINDEIKNDIQEDILKEIQSQLANKTPEISSDDYLDDDVSEIDDNYDDENDTDIDNSEEFEDGEVIEESAEEVSNFNQFAEPSKDIPNIDYSKYSEGSQVYLSPEKIEKNARKTAETIVVIGVSNLEKIAKSIAKFNLIKMESWHINGKIDIDAKIKDSDGDIITAREYMAEFNEKVDTIISLDKDLKEGLYDSIYELAKESKTGGLTASQRLMLYGVAGLLDVGEKTIMLTQMKHEFINMLKRQKAEKEQENLHTDTSFNPDMEESMLEKIIEEKTKMDMQSERDIESMNNRDLDLDEIRANVEKQQSQFKQNSVDDKEEVFDANEFNTIIEDDFADIDLPNGQSININEIDIEDEIDNNENNDEDDEVIYVPKENSEDTQDDFTDLEIKKDKKKNKKNDDDEIGNFDISRNMPSDLSNFESEEGEPKRRRGRPRKEIK
ncbi:MAG: hypothetical protein KatS3mg096_621 [Candidatus Parcubacteria bacterium]|nr:MAG: hypothetical protein KatS3mg096_621 [Candidatus Parcubacteria bacterium]